MSRLKVLFVYPNTPMLNPPPVSIGIFVALLRERGIEVRVFDTTFYIAPESSDKAKEANLQVRPFAFDQDALPLRHTQPGDDLRELIREYRPDLIAVSALEATWEQAAALLDAAGEAIEAPVVVGGVFPTFASRFVLRHPRVSMVCVGEGEGAIVELCERLEAGCDYRDVANLLVKTPSGLITNPVRPVLDLNELPVPDYSVFHPARLLRPMAGTVYRAVPIETNRGCPFGCSFCNSPSMVRLYHEAGAGRFFRKKHMDRIEHELRTLITRHQAEYCYFLSDTFLALTDEEFDCFVEIYSQIRLPFWIQSRAETITPYRAHKLKEIGCHRISMGLEHGNPDFRKRILNKKFDNSRIIRAAKILAEASIPLSVNNIIGFPDETRELALDTIELNRHMPSDTVNAYAFTPFHGTRLHEYCVSKGYIDEERVVGCLTMDTPLDMPQFSRHEIDALRRTFAMYVKLPKELWPQIRIAEGDSLDAKRTFEALSRQFVEEFF